jgi:tRNA A-37 threonylcarbamoyl transferase component Bud32
MPVSSSILTVMVYAAARWEVALRSRALNNSGPPSPDALSPDSVPSVRSGDNRDRVLAEIDQWGYGFAVDARDQPLFQTRTVKEPRRFSEILIVLAEGRVRLRKRMMPNSTRDLGARIRRRLRWEFYLEAAALLRLRGLDGVPTLRRIDARTGLLEMDYIWGQNVHQEIVASTDVRSCAEANDIFSTTVRRVGGTWGPDVRRIMDGVMKRGVFPLDIHPANFIRGNNTNRLYLVDYHLVSLRPIPDGGVASRL